MDLFEQQIKDENRLPCDGEVFYHGQVFPAADADYFYQKLVTQIEWRPDEVFMFGKHIETRRKVAWYGDQPFHYTYSGKTRTAIPWSPLLRELKQVAEQHSGENYNSCLLNLYHNGREGMAWHSDAEPELKKEGAIASVTFGAERRFAFRHKQSGQTVAWVLEHGSLMIMKGATQQNWLHRLPPAARIHTPRINLTFRTIEAST